MRQVPDHVGRAAADLTGHRHIGLRWIVEVTFETGWRGKEAEPFGDLDQEPVKQDVIDPVRLAQGVGYALRRVLIKIQTRCAKGQIQIDQNRAGHDRFRERVGDIVREDG